MKNSYVNMAKVPNLKTQSFAFLCCRNLPAAEKMSFFACYAVNIILWIILWKLCITLIFQDFFKFTSLLCFGGTKNFFRFFLRFA